MNFQSFLQNISLGTVRGLAVAACFSSAFLAHSIAPMDVEWHNEAADTLRINSILSETVAKSLSTGSARMAFIGESLVGTPYVAHTLEGDEEKLRVNLEQLDCTTFVETVAALALTAGDGRTSWRDFLFNLENIRYRGGEMDGYNSRLHYICDWVVNNAFRGNLKEITQDLDGLRYAVKTIDFMSANRDKYPSLADSATFVSIREIEDGYRNHRYPFVKASNLGNSRNATLLRSGDILAFTSILKNLDVTHLGMVLMRDGVPHVLHASLNAGKVVVTDGPLSEFMHRNRQFTGARVLRLRD